MSKSDPSLLKKYEIPLNHLSYEYVADCKNVRELEKIIKILRSGEEGVFPLLVDRAETRLMQLNPKSRVLRKEEPALNPSSMDNEQWNDVSSQLKEWSESTRLVDSDLKKEYELLAEGKEAPIRGSNDLTQNPLIVETNNNVDAEKIVELPSSKKEEPKRVKLRSYADWDKFDADEELLRLETAEERQIQEVEKARKKATMYKPMSRSPSLGANKKTDYTPPMSPQEKLAKAAGEKQKGNEYFKTGEYNRALYFYDNSIKIYPTIAAFNNRALCYFRTKAYKECIADCNAALKRDSVNVKALYRRACANREIGQEGKAYADLMVALEQDPNNQEALKLAHELVAIAEASHTNPESRRLSASEPSAYGKREDTPDYPGDYPPSLAGGDYEHLPKAIHVAPKYHMTKWGLPSVMCKCDGTPSWVNSDKRCKITEIIDDEDSGKNAQTNATESRPKITEIQPEVTDRNPSKKTENHTSQKQSTTTEAIQPNSAARIKELETLFRANVLSDEFKTQCTLTEIDEEKPVGKSKITKTENRADKNISIGNDRCRLTDITEQGQSEKVQEVKGGKRMRIVEVNNIDEMDVKCFATEEEPSVGQPGKERTVQQRVLPMKPCVDEGRKAESGGGKIVEIVPIEIREVKQEDDNKTETSSKEVDIKCKIGKKTGGHIAGCGDGINQDDIANEVVNGTFFLLKWATLRDPSYLQHAKLLNSIKPQDLSKTIGNSLDEQMLSIFLACLDQHWTLFAPPLCHEYLVKISQLQRFSFVHCFLEDKDKLAIKNILKLLRNKGIEVSHTLEAIYEI